MTMGEKTQTVFQITRSPKERVVKMYVSTDWGSTYNKADKLELTADEWGSTSYIAFGIVANYEWKVAELPEELKMQVDYADVDSFPERLTAWTSRLLSSLSRRIKFHTSSPRR